MWIICLADSLHEMARIISSECSKKKLLAAVVINMFSEYPRGETKQVLAFAKQPFLI